MKAEVIKRFRIDSTLFKVGDIVDIVDGAVCFEDYWICDVLSPSFDRHFKIIE